jgi:hypothetical protein
MMGKREDQENAKSSQMYSEEGRSCANCGMHTFEMILPKWMEEDNKRAKENGQPERYGDGFKQKKKMRCRRGGFAVKASAVCNEHLPIIKF